MLINRNIHISVYVCVYNFLDDVFGFNSYTETDQEKDHVPIKREILYQKNHKLACCA